MTKTNVSATLKKYSMSIVLVAVIILFAITTKGMILLPQNINNLLSQNAYVFVLGVGMLLCILTGGNIDLAVGSVVCFVGAIGASMMDKDINFVVAVITMLIVGILVGLWQGFWIAYINVPPFIATLAGMYAFRGLSNVVLEGLTVTIDNQKFLDLFGGGATCYVPDVIGSVAGLNMTCMVAGIIGIIIFLFFTIKGRLNAKKRGYETSALSGEIIKMVIISAVVCWVTLKLSQYKGIPTSLIWILLVVLVYGYITQKTKIGRYLYAVGGNKKAAQLSGVNVKSVYFFAYINMGFLSALAGILTIARATQSQPTFGQGYEMDAIGACFIGGASAYGGIGTVPGAIIGALLMGVINQGMSIMGIGSDIQRVVKGVVLLLAVIFDVVSKNEKK